MRDVFVSVVKKLLHLVVPGQATHILFRFVRDNFSSGHTLARTDRVLVQGPKIPSGILSMSVSTA